MSADSTHSRPGRSAILSEWLPLTVIITLAAALRFYALGDVPPGLYHDEAINGLDALRVLDGARPIFFEANNGREPLFIYLVAASVRLLGRTPLAVRAVSAALGTLTIPATYGMAKVLFDRRLAILTAATAAVTVWPINLSRVGFRAAAMPLFVALTVSMLWLGLRRQQGRYFTLGGTLWGLTFYTYLASRFTVVALAAIGLYWILAKRPLPEREHIIVLVMAVLIVILPLLTYLGTHWHTSLARSYQVSVFNSEINDGDLVGTLASNLGKTALMFAVRGDFIPRHNAPHRPVFDPLLATAFLVGAAITVRQVREPQYGFTLIWTGVMLLPTVLAEDAPHFLRSAGILPVVFVLPALGLRAIWRTVRSCWSTRVATAGLILMLTASLASTAWDYFVKHAQSSAAYYNFEAGATELAAEVNGFLGHGWHGSGGSTAEGANPSRRQQAYIDKRLWDGWAAVRFLIPQEPGVTIAPADYSPETPPERVETLLVLWPHGERAVPLLKTLPRKSVIQVREGAMERGDLEPEARLLYVTYRANPEANPYKQAGFVFDDRFELLGYDRDTEPGRRHTVHLFWHALARTEVNYTIFLHLRADGQTVAQDDSQPAQGYYPTSLWRPGDIIVDKHVVQLPADSNPSEIQAVVGFYHLDTMERLRAADASGKLIGDSVRLP